MMKTSTAVTWLAALMLAAGVTARAQEPGGAQGGQHQRRSPEQMAQHVMQKYDANKDGELSQDELAQALETMRKNHPPGGASSGAPQGGQDSQRQGPPPADKVAAQMIEKFSSDKKGLTQAELTKALEERRANHGRQGEQGP